MNLLRVDPRRVGLGPLGAGPALATLRDDRAAPGTRPGIAWREVNGSGRWEHVADGATLWGDALGPTSSSTRGACIDAQGWLVWAVGDRPTPGLLHRAMDLAACGPARVSLRPSTALTVDDRRDLAGAAVDPASAPSATLRLRDERGAVRVFPEVRPVPQRVWWDAQHRRVRYHRGEAGQVEVRTVGGNVNMPGWGASRTPASPPAGTPAPPTP